MLANPKEVDIKLMVGLMAFFPARPLLK
jgi:hypothetical protein